MSDDTAVFDPEKFLKEKADFFEFVYWQQIPTVPFSERMRMLKESKARKEERTKELTIEITDNCSLNCVHCSTEAGASKTSYMSFDDFANHVTNFSDFGKVRLSGGEPTNHPQFLRFVEFLKGQNKFVEVLSCGVQQGNRIADKVLNEGFVSIDNLVFSIHGDFATHNSVVGGSDNYWKKFAESAADAIYYGIPVSFHTVVMKPNFGQLETIAQTVACLRDLAFVRCRYRRAPEVDWHLLRLVKQGRARDSPELVLDDSQLSRLPKIVRKLGNKYLLGISCTNSFDGKECDCSTRKAVVMYDGSVIPCSALKGYSGNAGRFACKSRI